MSALRTREQERAADAWRRVRSVERNRQEYLALARGAAAYVQVSGLAQTLAFWRGKRDPEHAALGRHLSEWVMREMGAQGDLLDWLVAPGTGSDLYRRATMEALAYLTWIKRFAAAESVKGERVDG